MTPEQNVYEKIEGKPSRIIRFKGTLPGNHLAILDEEANILTISREKFDWLNHAQQEQVYVARESMVLNYGG